LPSDEEAERCLQKVYEHLTENGRFIVNVAYFNDDFLSYWRKGLETQETSHFSEEGERITLYTILGELDREKQLMYYDNLYRVSDLVHEAVEYRDSLQIRYYSIEDMRKLLQSSDFRIVREWGDYDGTLIGKGSEMIFEC